MRRVFVVLVLLAVMAGLKTLKADSLGGADPMTLAAIGFVVLAAFAIAELGADMSLPKVTGYIVSGVLLGPHVANVLSSTVVDEMRMFSTLALGLIATTAGLELDLGTLRRLAKTLLATVAAKIVLGLTVVGGVLFALELGFGLLDLRDTNSALALSLIFAALSLGTSPAIAIAIIEESRAKGRLSDLVLGAAVLKDVVVVVCLAVAISTARVLTEGGALRADVFLHVGQELGASIGAGAVLGVLFIGYIRFIRAEMLLFVAASILVTAEISSALHLELLLVFIVAGFVVRNYSKYEHDLLHALQTVSLPVFIVFFTNAGAGVDLAATWSLLPLALALCSARALAYVLASRFGAWAGGETPAVGRLAWLGYLPQAGVTLGLVGLAAVQLPDIAGPISALGMAVVAINLLAGPLTLRVALRKHGDLPDSATDSSPRATDTPSDEPSSRAEGTVRELENPELAALLGDAIATARERFDTLTRQSLDPWLAAWTQRFQPDSGTDDDDRATELAWLGRIVDRVEADEGETRAVVFARTFDDIATKFASLPEIVEVPLEATHVHVDQSDGFKTRWRKRLATMGAALRGRLRRRTRAVPAALIVRTAFDLRAAELVEALSRAWQRFEIECYELVHQAALGTRAVDFQEELARGSETLKNDWGERIDHAFRRGAMRASDQLARLGAPAHAATSVRYSAIESDVRDALERTRDDCQAWDGVRRAALNLLGATVGIQLARARLSQALQNTVTKPGDAVFNVLIEEVNLELARLDKVIGELEANPDAPLDDEAWPRLSMATDALLPRPSHKRLRSASNRLRTATSSRTVAVAVNEFVSGGEGGLSMLPSLHAVREAERPASVTPSTVNLAELHQVKLGGTLMPKLETTLEAASRHFAHVRHEMGECAQLAHFIVDNTQKDGTDQDAAELRRSLTSGLTHVRERLVTLADITPERWNEQRDGLVQLVRDTGDGLLDSLFAVTTAPSVRSQVRARLHDMPRLARLVDGYDRARAQWQRGVDLARGWIVASWQTRTRVETAWNVVGGGVNAAAIRRYLESRHDHDLDPDLPSVYAPLFAVDTLRDPRFFAAHRSSLRIVVDAERSWRNDCGNGNAVVITGSFGSGRTSLLATAELKLGTRRVAALRGRNATERANWMTALARELGSPRGELKSLEHTLGRTKGLVVIDDLHTWFPPTLAGLDALEVWLRLVVATAPTTLWLVSCLDETWDLLETTTGVRSVFADIAPLPPLGPRSLGAVLASRQELSGLGVQYPQTLWSRWLPRVRQASPRAEYLRRLCAASGGNLRRALQLWLHHATASPGDGASVHMRPIVDARPGLSFLRHLDALSIGALSALLRHGAQPIEVLTELLGEDYISVEQHLHFLRAAGLVSRQRDEITTYYVRPEVTDDLCHGMTTLGAFCERKALA